MIVEAGQTHSGIQKPFLYHQQPEFETIFAPYKDKIRFLIIESFPVDIKPKHYVSTPEAHDAWAREEYQRNYPLTYLLTQTDAIAFVCDADEIPTIEVIESARQHPDKFKSYVCLEMKLFYYNFQWEKKCKWHHPFAIHCQSLSTSSDLSQSRLGSKQDMFHNAGWHCSYFLSFTEIQRKIQSIAHIENNKEKYCSIQNIRKCLHQGIDLFGRAYGEELVWRDPVYETAPFGPAGMEYHLKVVESQKD